MYDALKYLLANSIAVCGGIFLVSTTSLMMALIAEYAFGLEPCILCIYQRWPYVITALLGVMGIAAAYKEEWMKFSALAVLLSSAVFFVGAVIAFYHVGVEQHWWKSALEGCEVDFDPNNVEDLMAILDNKPAVRCDVIPWADPVFGLSMAAYNAMMSFALGIGCAISSVMIARRANGVL